MFTLCCYHTTLRSARLSYWFFNIQRHRKQTNFVLSHMRSWRWQLKIKLLSLSLLFTFLPLPVVDGTIHNKYYHFWDQSGSFSIVFFFFFGQMFFFRSLGIPVWQCQRKIQRVSEPAMNWNGKGHSPLHYSTGSHAKTRSVKKKDKRLRDWSMQRCFFFFPICATL